MLRRSTPPVTSSMSRRRGWVASARASSRRLRWPVESTRACACRLVGEPDTLERLERLATGTRGIGRLLEGAHHHVLEHRHLGEGLELLEGARHAEPADLVGPESGDGMAVQQHLARVRRLKAREQIEERGLARAVGTDDADQLARAHLEGDVVVGHEPAEALRHPAHVQQDSLSPTGGEGRVRGEVVRGKVARGSTQPVLRRPRLARAMMPPGWTTDTTMMRTP